MSVPVSNQRPLQPSAHPDLLAAHRVPNAAYALHFAAAGAVASAAPLQRIPQTCCCSSILFSASHRPETGTSGIHVPPQPSTLFSLPMRTVPFSQCSLVSTHVLTADHMLQPPFADCCTQHPCASSPHSGASLGAGLGTEAAFRSIDAHCCHTCGVLRNAMLSALQRTSAYIGGG